MTRWTWKTGLAALTACGMMLCPAAPLMAAAPAPAATAPQSQTPQFALDANNTLPGVVVDLNGQPQAGQTVDLHKNGESVGKAVTQADGTFRLVVPVGTAQGEYLLTVGPQTVPCRIWNADAAPPTARTTAALAAGAPAVRGQEYCPPDGYAPHGGVPSVMGLDFVTLFTLGAAGTAAVLSGINQSDINDIEDSIESVNDNATLTNAQFAAIQQRLDDIDGQLGNPASPSN